MRLLKKGCCDDCLLKCDLCLTAREMNIEGDLKPIHNQFKKHELISRQGEPVTHAIILLGGNAKIFIDGINSKNIILNILLPSNYIGLMAVFGSPEYKYNVAALNDCITCHVDIATVRKMYYGNLNFMHKLNIQIGESISSMMSKLISLNQKQVRGKVAESLLYLSELYDTTRFTLSITRRELGELSAISEENAVRVLTEFRNEGIIDMKGREIDLRDIIMLRKISAVG
ncbi:MAG: Crp/Fnr family transcriptional regulator [Bacteroidales bacterium]|nr:Crp/Fnr family transcriptional regulator [Bacteroidales bacterium]